ncbi:MAG: M6 family metalloprotease domain-containing protein [Muribaculaceae bacterium]|nr:M6 family metalloprotease domain-containing protein [Muribaculaceae bacterium]
MNSVRRLALAALIALSSAGAHAVPAKPGIHRYELPDGTSIPVSIVGDEHFHYYVTTDGYPLTADGTGRLFYAKADSNGDFVSTGVEAHDMVRRTAAEMRLLRTIDPDAAVSAAMKVYSRRAAESRRRIPSEIVTKYPTTGNPKSIVLLVEFQDVKFTIDNPRQAFENLVKQEGYDYNGATGSAADYYRDNSYGNFVPDFQVFGPVTLPQTEPWYGAETASTYDVQGWLMARDGIKVMCEQYPDIDFSEYDNDGDGYVDNVFIFYAGYGQNEGAPGWTIWPHAAELWDMYGIDLSYNGVKFNKYACTNELRGTNGARLTGIGTFVHEYSHILGLLDHYATRLASSDMTPGSFDVMDNGSYNNDGNTPPNFSSFERYCLGWLNPRRLAAPENVVLEPLHESNSAVMVTTESDNEFFLFENRQNTGWDSYIGGHGMLVWHIDYDKDLWDRNSANNEYSHQRIDLVEADGVHGGATRSGDPFPGTSNVRNFTASTTPAMITWFGVDLEMPITDIAEVDGTITFRVKGGGDALEVPEVLEATDVTPTSFTANWKLVPGIRTYELSVSLGSNKVPFFTTKVESTTSCKVDNLSPSTDYNYVVRSCDGDRTSYDSKAMSVQTLAPTLDMLRPVALKPLEVSENGFTARWEAMDGVAGYKLAVYAKDIIDPAYETVDFTDGLVLPDGWNTNSTTTGSLKNYVGKAAPSLRMMFDGERVVTADYPGFINSLSFWYRGNSTDDDASISVDAQVGGTWQTVLTVNPVIKTQGNTVTVGTVSDDALMPPGTTRMRIVFGRGAAGSLYVDDIVLGHDGSFEPQYAEGWESADCGTELSAVVSGLSTRTQYFYTVTAYDADGLHSLPSEEIDVFTAQSGVAAVGSAGNRIFGAEGAVCVSLDAEAAVTVTTPSGVVVYSRDRVAGVISVPLSPGVYVVHAGAETAKVTVR